MLLTLVSCSPQSLKVTFGSYVRNLFNFSLAWTIIRTKELHVKFISDGAVGAEVLT